MSADLKTNIQFKGTVDEIQEMMKVIKYYENEKAEQYKAKRDCAYFVDVKVVDELDSLVQSLEIMTEGQIQTLTNEYKGMFYITAGGPYGIFEHLPDTGIFEDLADAAPTAKFWGTTRGNVTGANVVMDCELRSGLLYITYYYETFEEVPERYAEEIKKKLSYSKFCKLFKVDKVDFSEYSYDEFVESAIGENKISDMDYDQFLKYCDASGVDEDGYEIAMEKVKALDLADYDTFFGSYISEPVFETIYDAVAKKYLKNDYRDEDQNEEDEDEDEIDDKI